MKSDNLIKDATIANKSTWRKMIDKKAEDLHIKDVMTVTKKKPSKSPNPKRNRGQNQWANWQQSRTEDQSKTLERKTTNN